MIGTSFTAVFLLLLGNVDSPQRTALIVANDHGLATEPPLQYTSADAQRMTDTLVHYGRFDREAIVRIEDGDDTDIYSALRSATQSTPQRAVFLFFFSGHADGGALHVNGARVSIDSLLEQIAAVPARLRIVVVDACHSGAATTRKGVTPGPSFSVDVSSQDAEGSILISSSASDERSFESKRHQGSLFTFHWTSGLRGAADVDNDAQVTLSEAYHYAYARTLRDTLLSPGGPQHPSFKVDFTARRDPVLSYLNAASAVTVIADVSGEYVFFNRSESVVVAEVGLKAGTHRTIALAPGEYVIRKRSAGGLAEARVAVAEGRIGLLYEEQLKPVPLVRLVRKGGLGNPLIAGAVGQYFSALGPTGHLQATVGVRIQGRRWLFGADLSVAYGTEMRTLETRTLVVGPTVTALHAWRLGRVALRAGPLLGCLYVRQELRQSNEAAAVAGLAGGRVQADFAAADYLDVFAFADLAAFVAGLDSAPDIGTRFGKVGVLPWAAYGVGARHAW